jgi:hypothetical protein
MVKVVLSTSLVITWPLVKALVCSQNIRWELPQGGKIIYPQWGVLHCNFKWLERWLMVSNALQVLLN